MSIETLLLESHLKRLGLPTFIQNHTSFAVDAAQSQHSYSRYLLALAEQEVAQREANTRQRRLKEAKFPVIKELRDFEFAALPALNQAKILHLAQGEYIRKIEPIILVGNPGLGKTHVATGLAVEACRQHYRVRFYNAAALVNEPQRRPAGTTARQTVRDHAPSPTHCPGRAGFPAPHQHGRPPDFSILFDPV